MRHDSVANGEELFSLIRLVHKKTKRGNNNKTRKKETKRNCTCAMNGAHWMRVASSLKSIKRNRHYTRRIKLLAILFVVIKVLCIFISPLSTSRRHFILPYIFCHHFFGCEILFLSRRFFFSNARFFFICAAFALRSTCFVIYCLQFEKYFIAATKVAVAWCALIVFITMHKIKCA